MKTGERRSTAEKGHYAQLFHKHGPAKKRPEYGSWRGLVARCYHKTNKDWPRYGGTGIRVCKAWRGQHGFWTFFEDMGPRPSPKHSIDRIDGTKGYEPTNCRWATVLEQQNNRRSNHFITIDGTTQTAASWARLVGLPRQKIIGRLAKGWDPRAAVFGKMGEFKQPAHERLGLTTLKNAA